MGKQRAISIGEIVIHFGLLRPPVGPNTTLAGLVVQLERQEPESQGQMMMSPVQTTVRSMPL